MKYVVAVFIYRSFSIPNEHACCCVCSQSTNPELVELVVSAGGSVSLVGEPPSLPPLTMATKAESVASVTSQCSFSSTIVHVGDKKPPESGGNHQHSLNHVSICFSAGCLVWTYEVRACHKGTVHPQIKKNTYFFVVMIIHLDFFRVAEFCWYQQYLCFFSKILKVPYVLKKVSYLISWCLQNSHKQTILMDK